MAVILVETFEVRVAEQQVDDEEGRAALEIARKMGLDGQVKAHEEARSVAPVPYEPLGILRKRILSMIAPGATDLKSYSCLVPMRVLQAAEQAAAAGLDAFKVRHLNSARVVDPVVTDESFLVATSSKQEYLVARWGLSLSTWGALEKLARERYARKFEEATQEIQAQARMDGTEVSTYADKYFGGEMNDYQSGMPTYHKPW